jgi:hypothetical protein
MKQHTLSPRPDDVMLATKDSVLLSQELYQKNPDDYIPGRCYDNCFRVLMNNRRKSLYATVCYGYLCSGIPKLNGVAVRHGWIVIDGQIVDVSVPAGGYPPANALCYLYIPWREYSVAEYLEAMDEEALPDIQMEKDIQFCRHIEDDIGYRCIG